jgi:hypothetical protein
LYAPAAGKNLTTPVAKIRRREKIKLSRKGAKAQRRKDAKKTFFVFFASLRLCETRFLSL